MKLIDYAKEELTRIGMIGKDPYNDIIAQDILELIELFGSQGHTGFTAAYTIATFRRLAMFKPLSPLTGEDDEWQETLGMIQNKRCFSVFKEKDGKAYDTQGKIFTDDGEIWYTNGDSHVEISFPYTVPEDPERVYLNGSDKEKEAK